MNLCYLITFVCSFVLSVQGDNEFYKVTDRVFFDVTIGKKEVGRIVIGLFGEIAPKTVKNFKTIATTGINGATYAGTNFHRVIKKFMIQGGDIVHNDGSGTISIYGDNFPDETFHVKHAAAGFIAMANSGPDTNGCQFYITTIATPWLDDRHVVFGKVVQGQNIVHIIEQSSTSTDDRPIKPIRIKKCGLLETPTSFYVTDSPNNIWEWIKASVIPLSFSFSILAFFHWMYKKLDHAEKLIDKKE